MRPRPLALLLVLPLLAACASGGEKDAPKTYSTPDAGPANSRGEEMLVPAKKGLEGPEKSAFYQQVDQLAETWLRASGEPGDHARADAAAAEQAAGRLVWPQRDMLFEDLKASPNPRWRSAAARALGFARDARTRVALESVLSEHDARLLNSALVTLGRMADIGTDDAAIEPLLRSTDPLVRGNAALCLARVFHARVAQDMAPLSPTSRVAEMEADLCVLLFDPADPIVRGNACQALGALRSQGAEDALLNRLRDDATFVRLKAAQALGVCGTPRSYAPLLDTMAREGETNVLTMLALGLGSVCERHGPTPPYAELGTDAGKWREWLLK